MSLQVSNLAVVLIFDITRFERLSLHNKFKQETPSRKDINLFSFVLSLANRIGDLRSITFK